MTTKVEKDAIRIKVIQHSNSSIESKCCRFTIAPELTSYEVLCNLISRAFDIQGVKYNTSYLARDDRFAEACWLPLTSDFDLELAFTKSSDPYLVIKVDFVAPSLWGLPSSIELPKLSLSNLANSNYSSKIPNLFKQKVEKTLSVVQKAFTYTEEEASTPRSVLVDAEFQKLLDSSGALKDSRDLRLRVYLGGVEPSLRRVVWKHLLNVYPRDMTGRERMDYMKDLTSEYNALKHTWQDYVENNQNLSDDVKYTTNMVLKDVLRTDRQHPFFSGPDDGPNVKALCNILTTYALNHPSVGYCQGMSDLASPILVTMKDEAQAYVSFCGLMRRLGPNFNVDGEAITLKFQHLTEALVFYDPAFFAYLQKHQAEDLLFCYRWLLLELKREFAFEDAMYMLEVLWSTLPPKPPDKKLQLAQERFKPVKEAGCRGSAGHQDHYTAIRALWRKRSHQRSESISKILRRRAASVDIGNPPETSDSADTLSALRRSNTMSDDREPVQVSTASGDSADSPKRVRDFNEFRLLVHKNQSLAHDDQISQNSSKEHSSEYNEISEGKRWPSESDAAYVSPSDCKSLTEVFDHGVGSPLTEKTETAADLPTRDSPSLKNNAQSSGSPNDSSAVNEASGSAWKIAMSGDAPLITLPSPDKLGGGNPFLIFLCVTLLVQHSRFIMDNAMDHNELAMYFDKMVRGHNVDKVLEHARKWFEKYLRLSANQTHSPDSHSENHQTC